MHLRFGLPAITPRELARDIKKADRAAAYLEATQLAGFEPKEAKRLFGDAVEGESIALVPMAPDAAKKAFVTRFVQLSGG